jgi:hypothetical protein
MPSTRPASQPQPTAPAGPYWDEVYQRRGAAGVSWFQAEPRTSLDLIRALAIAPDTPIIDAGAGAGSLSAHLAAAGQPAACRIRWIRADLLTWAPDRRYGLWHDRAVFHFLTDPASRTAYLATMRAALQPGGTVILAAFGPDGPTHCSGLPVARYSPGGLAAALGPSFTLTGARGERHTTPGGAIQPFTWITATFR